MLSLFFLFIALLTISWAGRIYPFCLDRDDQRYVLMLVDLAILFFVIAIAVI